MLTNEILSSIDNIDEVTMEAEMNVISAMINEYDKAAMIMENYNGDSYDCFEVFQEGFKDQVNQPVFGNKGENIFKRIIMVIPRLIALLVRKIKSAWNNRKSQRLQREIEELRDLHNNQREQIGYLTKAIVDQFDAVNGNISELQSRITRNEGNTLEAREGMLENRERIDTLEDRVSRNKASQDEQNAALSKRMHELNDETNSRINTTNRRVNDVRSDMDDHIGRLERNAAEERAAMQSESRSRDNRLNNKMDDMMNHIAGKLNQINNVLSKYGADIRALAVSDSKNQAEFKKLGYRLDAMNNVVETNVDYDKIVAEYAEITGILDALEKWDIHRPSTLPKDLKSYTQKSRDYFVTSNVRRIKLDTLDRLVNTINGHNTTMIRRCEEIIRNTTEQQKNYEQRLEEKVAGKRKGREYSENSSQQAKITEMRNVINSFQRTIQAIIGTNNVMTDELTRVTDVLSVYTAINNAIN